MSKAKKVWLRKGLGLWKSLDITSFSHKCTSQHPHNFPRLMNNKRDETLYKFVVRIIYMLKTWSLHGVTINGKLFTHALLCKVPSPKPHKFLHTHLSKFKRAIISIVTNTHYVHQGYSHILTHGNKARHKNEKHSSQMEAK
jgi:hypothetical protein